MTQEFAERKGWRIIPTGTSLSTGTDMDRRVLGMVDTSGAYLHLLPRTEHEVRLRLDETLVVGNTDLFEVLVGNHKMKPVADSLVQYPTAQLQLFPNILESPDYAVTLPRQRAPSAPSVLPCTMSPLSAVPPPPVA